MELVRQKNIATYIVFPIVDADGDFVTGATDLDSEIDGWSDSSVPNGFTDCSNEATEIGSTGIYSLSLTLDEMNNDYIVIQIQTSSSGAKTQMILIRTMVGDPLNIATTDDNIAIDASALNILSSHDPGAIFNNVSSSDIITACGTALTNYDVPTNTELEARTLLASAYLDSDAIATALSVYDVPTNTDLEARTLLASAYFDYTTDSITISDKTGFSLSSASITSIWEEIIESTLDAKEFLRNIYAVSINKSTGGGTSEISFRDIADTKNRVTSTVDENGNRLDSTIDGT